MNPANMTEHTVVRGLARMAAERTLEGSIKTAMNAQEWAESRVTLSEKASHGGRKAGQETYGVYWRVGWVPDCCKVQGEDCVPAHYFYVLENKDVSREDLIIALTEAAILHCLEVAE